ncbi:unnamed protein product [Dicrocoelium dendriticum]|nr:unnamed protein product [Dicrocoelium dendriticum]
MSDSDSTWPATDDFGSRFLEIDEYAIEALETETLLGRDDATEPNYGFPETSASLEPNSGVRTNRGLRLRSLIELENEYEEDDCTVSALYHARPKRTRVYRPPVSKISNARSDSDEESSFKRFHSLKATTARQRSLQMQRIASQPSEHNHLNPAETDPAFLSLESLEPSKPSSVPTPEQLAARQLSITRRRESAKRKVELQKRQTVERLLKINADSDNFSRRGRGRGRGARNISHSVPAPSVLSPIVDALICADECDNSTNVSRIEDDETSEPDLDTSGADATLNTRTALAEQHGLSGSSMDPPFECIRLISSSRLSPTNRVCFPTSLLSSGSNVSSDLSWILTPKPPPIVPEAQPCAAGCGRTRRYKCSKTGVPLCSLACYKQNLANWAVAH